MKWWLIAGSVLAVLVLVPLIVGALLPTKHVVSRSVVVPRPPEVVFALITDVANAPSWREGLHRVELLGEVGGRTRFREVSKFGELTFEVEQATAPRLFVVRIADTGEGFGGSWTYELEPTGTSTRVTITENGEVYSPLFRFLSRFVFGHEATLTQYITALEKRLAASS